MKRIEHMSRWERSDLPEILRGLSVTGYHFWRNLSIHILHAFGPAAIIANLVTVDSEQRLGQTLLQLARTLGKKDPRSIHIELKDFARGIIRDGPHDAVANQLLHAEISQLGIDRNQ